MNFLDFRKKKDKTHEFVNEKITFPSQESYEDEEVKIYAGVDWGSIDYNHVDIAKEWEEKVNAAKELSYKNWYEKNFFDRHPSRERFYAVFGGLTFEQFCDHIDALIYHANEFNDGEILEIEYNGIVLTEIVENNETSITISVVRDIHVLGDMHHAGSLSNVDVITKKVPTSFDVIEGEDGKCDLKTNMKEEYSINDLVSIMRVIVDTARNNVEGYW